MEIFFTQLEIFKFQKCNKLKSLHSTGIPKYIFLDLDKPSKMQQLLKSLCLSIYFKKKYAVRRIEMIFYKKRFAYSNNQNYKYEENYF